MNTINAVIFVKKLILPSNAANTLQSLNMAYGFASLGIKTFFYPGIKGKKINQILKKTLYIHNIIPSPHIKTKKIKVYSKGMYGFLFRFFILYKWLTSQKTIFYARDVKEGSLLAWLKKNFPNTNYFFFEMHEVLHIQHSTQNRKKSKIYKKKENFILSHANGLIAINHEILYQAKKHFKSIPQSIIVPMGFNEKTFKPRKNYRLHNPIRLCYAGSLYQEKGLDLLVEAFSIIPNNYMLTIIGGSPSFRLKELQDKISTHNISKNRYFFTGNLPPKEVGKYLSISDIFIIPQITNQEFFSPIKIFEAFGSGLPIIATPIPAFESILKHKENSIIADSISVESLAKAIFSLSQDEDLALQIHKNIVNNRSKYSWNNRAQKCLDFITETVSQE